MHVKWKKDEPMHKSAKRNMGERRRLGFARGLETFHFIFASRARSFAISVQR